MNEFDTRWENWSGDFTESFAASLLDPAVREYVPEILGAFARAAAARDRGFPDDLAPGTLAAVLTEVLPRLALPETARPHVPEVVARFFEYLRETGRLAEGDEFAARVRVIATSYRDRLKPGGGVKGVPIRKAAGASAIGRNDPCPCGSGKKFKKCCMNSG
jgi:uncharacterized protein YecA (UPF0149 family)